MNNKKVTPFQFKTISREALQKEKIITGKKVETSSLKQGNIGPSNPIKPKTDHDLLRHIGDKERLTSMEEKFQVIDYVFKRNPKFVAICHCCGNKAGSKYYVSYTRHKALTICAGCYQALPTCDNCGVPIQPNGPKLPTQFCAFCKVTRSCNCCGSSITAKESHRIPFVKGTYCVNCYQDAPQCVVCHIPMTEKESVHFGGERICTLCKSRNITPDDARELNEAIIRLLNERFNIKETILYLVGLATYRHINPTNETNKLGAFINVSGNEILALYKGTSRERGIGVMAYEYGKQLLKQLNPVIQNVEIVEGFALWTKSFILREFGEIDEVSMIKSKVPDNPILKSLLNIERLGGIARIAERVKEGVIGKK